MFKSDMMGVPGAYFARRWMLDFGIFSIRLHNWFGSDDPDAFHDHANSFIVIVLKGGYTDFYLEADGTVNADILRVGSIRFRKAEYKHIVKNDFRSTWTFCFFGKPFRRWSFYKGAKRYRRDKYFAEVGHHTSTGDRIRLRPDGSII